MHLFFNFRNCLKKDRLFPIISNKMSSLSEILKRRRKELNLSPEEIAEKIGKSKRSYLYYEEDKQPRHDVLQKLAQVLQFDPSQLYENAKSTAATMNNNEEKNSHTEELINSLKKNIEVLEKHMKEYEEREKILIKANTDLKSLVHANLKTVLENQLTLTALSESFLKSFSELMIEEPEQQQSFRIGLHKEAFARLSGALGKGSHHLVIDSDDIVTSET